MQWHPDVNCFCGQHNRETPQKFLPLFFLSQHPDPPFDLRDDRKKFFIAFPCRIGQIPVVIKRSADVWASNLASHGDRKIGNRNPIGRFAVLRLFHINAVALLYQSDRIRIDLRFCLRPRRIKVKLVSAQMLSERLRYLTAAGVVDTENAAVFFFIPCCSSLLQDWI